MDPRRNGVAYWQNKCSNLERENAELRKQLKDREKEVNLMLKKRGVSGNKRSAGASSSPGGGDVDNEPSSSGSISEGTGRSRKKAKLGKDKKKGDKENVEILLEPEPDVSEELMQTYAQLENAEKFVQILIKHLDKKSVLTCRLTCRRWNAFIQQFFETHPMTYPISVPPPVPMTSTSHELFRGITVSPSNIQKFHKHVEHWTKINPGGEKPAFLSRNLTLSPELAKGSTAAFAFFQKVNHLLETFGIHEDVWYLTIIVRPEDPEMAPPPNVYHRWVQNCLVKMRNLRSVTLTGQLEAQDEDFDEKELVIQMRPFKLPVLPSLKYLCFMIENLPGKVEEQFFVKYGGQLRKLRVSLETLLKCRQVTENQLEENLTDLLVYFDGENTEKHVELLLKILKAPKLQRLKLEIHEMTEEQIVGCARKFGELVDLKIECEKVIKGRGAEEEAATGGGGGKVKLLELNDDGIGSYDFLREFSGSLEYLKVRGSSKEPVEEEGKKEGEEGTGMDLREWMYGDEENSKVYQSRIWEILGNLREFVFVDEDPEGEGKTEMRRYTMEGYNRACERAEEEAKMFKMALEDVKEIEEDEVRKEEWQKVLDEVEQKGKQEEMKKGEGGEEEIREEEETVGGVAAVFNVLIEEHSKKAEEAKKKMEEALKKAEEEEKNAEEIVKKTEEPDPDAAWKVVLDEAKKKMEEALKKAEEEKKKAEEIVTKTEEPDPDAAWKEVLDEAKKKAEEAVAALEETWENNNKEN